MAYTSDGATEEAGEEPAEPKPTVVGIGASAGGLSALKEFFDNAPENGGVSYVVVVHLSPEHGSHLAELLQPHVRMPVDQVTETVPLAPDHVYVIPPAANLSAIDTHLRLSPLEAHVRERAPIDHFFRTLAATHDGHAVGVILSGTGSDGTLGIKEIKEKGGLTIVQSPSEAEYDGMPQSALATGLVDLVLPIAEIPAAVVGFARTAPRIQVPPEGEDVEGRERRLIQKVFAHLRARTGRDFSRYKRSTMLRRIGRRMQLNQIEELESYVDLLRENPDEVRTLADDLLITVTNFFRDPEVFSYLERDVIPRIFERRLPTESVRVWSVGCATGEEAYSLAILLLEAASRVEGVPPRVQVFASDLHEGSLVKAREGFYPGDIEAEVQADRLRRFFQKEDGGFRVKKEVREAVVFAPHNLLSDPPFSKLDLISCRNMLIYLQREVQNDIIDLFHYALNPDGFLVLGSSETADANELFQTVQKKLCVYRRRSVPAPEPRLPVFPLLRARVRSDAERDRLPGEPAHYGALHERIVEQYAPPSILLNAEDKVMHLSEHAGRYLAIPGGEPTVNVFKLVREELRIELRAAMHLARERKRPITSKPVLVRFNGESGTVVLQVRPAHEPNQEGFMLVIFDEREAEPEGAPDARSQGDHAQIQELESELQVMKQRLQAIIEEYETSQEEMKASNEELQSANEELRSTMEELETSKEELQSMNEELQTVNQENRHKVEELAQLSSDLQNLMAATDIATLFLDRELRILRYTPKVGALFNVRTTDKGRPLSDLTHRLGYGELITDASRVLETLIPAEREVADDEGRWYLTRVLPYRSTDDRIEGVVITFVDITERKRAEADLRQINETLEERVTERTRQVRELAHRLTMAEQEERRRISRILHDDLQQLLYGVEIKLGMVRQELHVDQPTLQKALDDARGWIDTAIQTARELTVDLSPPILQDEGLVDALYWLQRQMKELHNLDVEIEAEHSFSIRDEDLRVLLFHVIRELLFNVKKHAGVDHATIDLREEPGVVVIRVRDSGKGFSASAVLSEPSAHAGYGLTSIRERLSLLGGELRVRSSPGNGTEVEVRAPLRLSGAS